MDRRDFLRGGGAALAVLPLQGASVHAAGPAASATAWTPPAAGDWSALRTLFSLRRDRIQLATFLLASHPAPVRAAIDRYRDMLDLAPAETLHAIAKDAEARVRAAAGRYLHASPDLIALTDSTTMGLAMVYSGIRVQPGEVMLHTAHDHYSTFMSMQHRATREGVAVETVALYDKPATASVDVCLARLRAAIKPETRVLAVTWVHSSTGVKLPIQAIGDLVRSVNARRPADRQLIYCVDGVHGLGVEDIDVEAVGCDFFIAGTHKWIFGPRGTGLICSSQRGWEQCREIIPSFGRSGEVWRGTLDLSEVAFADRMSPGGFHSFEHRWALDEAFALHMQLGKAAVESRIHELNSLTKSALAGIARVVVHTPVAPDLSAGLVCFDIKGMPPADVVMKMFERGVVMSQTPYRETHARFAPSLLNTEAEIQEAVAGIAELARS